jgi:hypothetical protein
MRTQNINHPPTHIRFRLLEQYYKNLDKMDHIDSLVTYKNNMAVVYKKYNPWMKIRFYKREHFLPKEEDYFED